MENSVIMLDEEQRSGLEKFAKNGVHNAHQIKRARVILALDRSNKKDHLRISRISEALELSRQAIYNIKDDFLKARNIDEFLTRKKRETPPVPAKITGEVEAKIIALACGEPPKGNARWTVRLLAQRSVELSIVADIGRTAIHELLKKRNINLI